VPGAWELISGRLGEAARQGHVYVQDRSSQLVARLAAHGDQVLDACAAPGGKSLLLADLLGGAARVIAAEASPRRLLTLASLARLWGAEGLHAVGADARRPPFRSTFDTVLVDAPCSGLGTLARHPDIRWRLRPADLRRQASRQAEILDTQAALVSPGGRLVYATCSIEPEENEGVVVPFLEKHPEFHAEPVPDWARPFASGPFVRTLPEVHGGDAFFAAILRHDASQGAGKTIVVG
jgi:16S rRNA (cytosine967-C5)-methyltransferase